MNGTILLLLHLLSALAKLIRPGRYRSIIAENLLLKQQLIIHSRARRRSPNLSTHCRTVLGFLSLFLSPRRITRAAVIIKPSTPLSFHNALKKRKYRLLYSPHGGRKAGPKTPSGEVIKAIVEMKRRNPRYGCPRIDSKSIWRSDWSWTRARCGEYLLSITLKTHWFMVVMDQYTRRVVGFVVHAGNVDGPAACRLFDEATAGLARKG